MITKICDSREHSKKLDEVLAAKLTWLSQRRKIVGLDNDDPSKTLLALDPSHRPRLGPLLRVYRGVSGKACFLGTICCPAISLCMCRRLYCWCVSYWVELIPD